MRLTSTGSRARKGDQEAGRDFVLPADICTTHSRDHFHCHEKEKNIVQSKIPQKPERGPGETEITSLPEKEFKIKVITRLMELQRNIQELRDEVWREITQMKETIEGFKSRLDEVEETFNGIEIREQEHREAEAERDKRIPRNERILRELCDQSKWNNIHMI